MFTRMNFEVKPIKTIFTQNKRFHVDQQLRICTSTTKLSSSFQRHATYRQVTDDKNNNDFVLHVKI